MVFFINKGIKFVFLFISLTICVSCDTIEKEAFVDINDNLSATVLDISDGESDKLLVGELPRKDILIDENVNFPAEEAVSIIDPLSEAQKVEIAQTLMEDFKFQLSKIEEELALQREVTEKEKQEDKYVKPYEGRHDNRHALNVLYHSTVATDKLLGLRGVFRNSISDEDDAFISNAYKKIIKGDLSIVYSGYSQSGIHVIMLLPFSTSGSLDYARAIINIRNDENENDIMFNQGGKDIYVEDLTNKRSEFVVDFYDEETGILTHFPNMEENNTRKEYNRVWTSNGILKDRTWYLFSGVGSTLTVVVNGEKIKLRNSYYDVFQWSEEKQDFFVGNN
jgi:hypothetical protein